MPIGIGYDIHKISSFGTMTLGGITIESLPAFEAESDGDVIIHAVIDALLGATNNILENNKDISDFFNSDKTKTEKDSRKILVKVLETITQKKILLIVNIDIVVIAARPKIKDYKEEIITNLTNILNLDKKQITIKGKSNNGIGETGSGKAVSCMAIIETKN
ncbi:MAG: 2-C-methyl-D-erythritol 2,4-cyclodiphosphate synthase [Dehalococcoidia bacterium]|nr:2-C-methyl-D-erythritol 2,4-cyclodiphosphate synthase [Dehalococcoidia bacterium]